MGSEWGAAAIGAAVAAVLGAVGILIARRSKARGGLVKDEADASVVEAGAAVIISAEERKARAEQAEIEIRAQTARDESNRRQDSLILKEYKALAAQQRQDLAENREQIHELRGEMQQISNELAICRAGRARADERIGALEQALQDAGIPHRKWTPDPDGSGVHAPHSPKPPKPSAPESQL